MSFTQQGQIAEKLRRFIATCPSLPVKAGALSLDRLSPDGRQMSVNFQAGQVVKAYANGRKTIRQPFGVYYRAAQTDDDLIKSEMLGAVNSIGQWLDTVDCRSLDLGEGINVTKLAQATWAFILEHNDGNIAYNGDFVLEYNQRAKTK